MFKTFISSKNENTHINLRILTASSSMNVGLGVTVRILPGLVRLRLQVVGHEVLSMRLQLANLKRAQLNVIDKLLL